MFFKQKNINFTCNKVHFTISFYILLQQIYFMKKIQTFSWLGAGFMLLSLASCSNDMPVPSSGDRMTFNVSLPEDVSSRAYGDGLSATNLFVAIYESGSSDKTPMMSNFADGVKGDLIDITSLGNNKFTVSVQLVRGEEYDVVFWAQSYESSSTAYTYNAEEKTISVDYSKLVMNNEAPDAFYALENITGGSAQDKDVFLKRPFAQVNVGASDYQEYVNAAGRTIVSTSYTFSKVPTTFSLADGKAIATESDADITYEYANIPDEYETFPSSNTSIKYLSMAYILAGTESSDKGVTNVTLNIKTQINETTTGLITRNFSDVSVQTNYRTNIYGPILTNESVFNVQINPMYTYATSWTADVWDGTITAPEPDENGNYLITSANQFAGISKLWSNNALTADTKIILATDIDLNGLKWVGTIGNTPKPAQGEIVGNNHTIKGLKDGDLFTIVKNFYIHDLNLEVISTKYSPLIDQAGDNTRVENVTVKAANNNAIPYQFVSTGFGSIIGTVLASSNVTVKNCTNYADIVKPATGTSMPRTGGGIVGSVQGSGVLTISNCNNYGNITADATAGTNHIYGVGGIVGGLASGATAIITTCNNTGNIQWTTPRGFAGGILGLSGYAGNGKPNLTIKDCTNSGSITIMCPSQSGLTNPAGAQLAGGGIFGGSNSQFFNTVKNDVMKYIIDCSNTGNIRVESQAFSSTISGNSYKEKPHLYGIYAGGVVGLMTWYDITVTGCSNSGNLSVFTPEPPENIATPIQAMAGIINMYAIRSLTLTNNTVFATVTMEGNRSPLIGGIYTWTRATKETTNATFPEDAVIENNTNSTSYPVSNR